MGGDEDYRELEMLKEQLNFEGFTELKASTNFERTLVQSGRSRTWHKVRSLANFLPKPRKILYLVQQAHTIIYFNEIFSGVDWLCIQEREENREANWVEKTFKKRCLSGNVVDPVTKCSYWNDGKIWEEGMVDFNLSLLQLRKWTPDTIFCDMGIYTTLSDCNDIYGSLEKKQVDVKKAEMSLALQALGNGGTLIIKLVGVAEEETRNVLATLTSCFESYQFVKAAGSNPLNSEVYCICLNLLSRVPAEGSKLEEQKKKIIQECNNEMKRQINEIKAFLDYRNQVVTSDMRTTISC